MSKKNPFVFLDVSIEGDPIDRMVFELFADHVPKTAGNFRALCTGEKGRSEKTGRPLHYKGSFFRRIIKGSMAQGGGFLKLDGSYVESIYGEKFPDESSKLKHDEPGLLSMAIADRDTRGSLFNITFRANHHLDRKHIVFGKLVEGHEVLKKMETVANEEDNPTATVKIINCGDHLNEIQSSDKKRASKLKNGKDASSESNSHELRHKRKHKKSSKDRRKRRRKYYYTSESDSSLDADSESSDSDSESDSDVSSSSSDISSSSDDRRKKRKRSSYKRDRYKRAKRRDRKREKKRRRREKRSKRKAKRALDTDSETQSKSESGFKNDNGDVGILDRKHKNPAQIIAGSHSPVMEHEDPVSQKKGAAADMVESEEGEYPKENGERQNNGIEVANRSEKSAENQPDVVDDHPGKSRSRSISPRRPLSKSMSISPRRSLSRSPDVGGSPIRPSRRNWSVTRSPARSASSRSPAARSVTRSPLSPKNGSPSPIPVRVRSRRSISRSPTSSPPPRSISRSPPRTSSRKSSRKSVSRSPVRSSRRSISRSSGRVPSRRSVSRSPIRTSIRNNRRSYSRNPVGAGRRARSNSRSLSPEGSSKRVRRGRGFSQRYSYARRYHSPDRSPVRSYRYGGRSDRDRDRYASYRRSPRHHRSPLRERTPTRYRGRRSRTRSPIASRSPIRYRKRRYSRSPTPVETSRYRRSSRVDRRRSPSLSRSPSGSRSSRSQSPSPKQASSREKSRSSSESPPGKKGLVSYGDGSPDSGQR